MSLYFSFLRYIQSQNGTAAIEYVLLASGIALAILVAVFAFGEDLSALYEGLVGALTSE